MVLLFLLLAWLDLRPRCERSLGLIGSYERM
jgi:hypothetical protein